MTENIVLEFKAVVNQTFGIYLDSIMGFQIALDKFIEVQNKMMIRQGIAISELDRTLFSYYSEELDEYLHNETQGEFKARMAKGGKNYNFAGNAFIITVYAYWEDHYRAAIAKSLGKTKEDLKSSIFGDIRLIRHCILHYNAVAFSDISKCESVTCFKKGDEICFSENQILDIVKEINQCLNSFFDI